MPLENNPDTGTEQQRLRDLRDYDLLDTGEEKEYNDLVELASAIAGTPISLITLLDETRQWFKARKGFAPAETSRDIAFCDYAIQQDQPLVVENALDDERFRNNPLVTGSDNVRFYAGFQLVTPGGSKLGTLCVLDNRPGKLTAQQLDMLSKLADKVVQLMELRRRNKELAALKTEAEAQRDMLNQLLNNQKKMMAILAHDTKGPLNSMLHLVDLMVTDDPQPDVQEMALGLMKGQLVVTLELIDNLIAWGGSQLDVQMYEAEWYEVGDLIKSAAHPMRRLAEEKGLDLQLQVARGTRFRINREMVRFMVRNLLHNAIKFTDKGTVKLVLSDTGGCSVIELTDTGIGMPESVRRGLFGRKMASREGTRREPGSGLGLLLVNDFVVKLGGSIETISAEGAGTTFIIRIPSQP